MEHLYHGNCMDLIRDIPDASIDSIVCDPPYGIDFMGSSWDSDVPDEKWAKECLRVLRPGGHIIAFAATRTYQNLATAVESAGFEIRDQLGWVYLSGFPKSMDVSFAFDRRAGVEREGREVEGTTGSVLAGVVKVNNKGIPVTPEAKEWSGWGTALKPTFEPAVLARKPFNGAVIDCVKANRTGAINIEGSRMITLGHQGGNFPANLVMFPKPSQDERHRGCADIPERAGASIASGAKARPQAGGFAGAGAHGKPVKNTHPTIKPVDLMRWLVRLVTPPNGVTLDPFMGSGAAGIAAVLEGFDYIGAELNEEYYQIAQSRIAHAKKYPDAWQPDGSNIREESDIAGQGSMF